MSFDFLALPAVALVSLTGLTLLVSGNWRTSIAALVVQYVGVFILVVVSWPLEMAIVKLIAGGMASAVLGLASAGVPESHSEGLDNISSGLFRLLAAGLVGLVVASVLPGLTGWLPEIAVEQLFGGGILIGLGLLHLGLTISTLRVILGLLTVLAGFEILYAAVETSVLVSGLLAGVNLGLALVGAYLLVVPSSEEPGEEPE